MIIAMLMIPSLCQLVVYSNIDWHADHFPKPARLTVEWLIACTGVDVGQNSSAPTKQVVEAPEFASQVLA